MAGGNFFDDDLVQQRGRAERIKMGAGDEPAVPVEQGGSLSSAPRQVADLNLTNMARHRKNVDAQAAQALQELEQLRQRQEQLESEKKQLEEVRRRHDDYDRGKREMIDHLKRSLVVLERQEVEAQRLSELYNATRVRFKELLQSVENLNEESWSEEQIRDELNKSLGIIEEARMEYNKATARVDAARNDGAATTASKSAVLFEDLPSHGEEKTFYYWLKVGVALSLPLAALAIIVLIIVMVGRAGGWF